MNRLEKARKSSGLTLDGAARIIESSRPTYLKKEKNPQLMTLGEFFKLYQELGEDERFLMWGELEDMREKSTQKILV